ncbi:hypothetical protein [Tardiphaga sp. P9-11]|uniref:hypothetical protein n=1 Tax=Tardiphaga sp. P9-11 TaxID=2024614 RepID=UPI0011F13DDA|nr:hypothetical protein [Tardiphaga sp. P9-11]
MTAALFEKFFSANPLSKYSETIQTGDAPEKDFNVIEQPWGDDSLVLMVPDDAQAFADVLNQVILPPRFSAVWHIDTKDLEIIWTAFSPTDTIKEFSKRKFTFNFKNRDYTCEFGSSSERLLAIGRTALLVRTSATSYRNLQSFTMLDHEETELLGEPMSFWIRDIEWNEDAVLEFAYHLNFYMTYYDTKSPRIIIHAIPPEKTLTPQTRFSAGAFPATIRTKNVDVNLLHFWLAARDGDAAQSFLFYYRILEYLSVYYLTASVRNALRKMLAKPNVLDDIPLVIENLITATAANRQEESQRMDLLLKDTVDAKLLWREIQNNLENYSSPTNFEGGFVLQSLITSKHTEEQFCQQGISTFANRIREVRNALSHGRDVKTAAVIAPTHRNFTLLQPWVDLICVAAGEAILYEDVL